MGKRSVSVVIPVYNGETYLPSALESVLGQTWAPDEVIVVDDGSTDGTRQVVERTDGPVKLIPKPHTGVGDTLNRGIAEVTAEYLAFLDADDLWVPGKLQVQWEALQNSGTDMVFGHIRQFISPELDKHEITGLECPPEPVPGYSRDTLLVKRETFLQVGWFATQYTTGEFIEWYARAKDMGLHSLMLADVLAHRRIHRTNMTRLAGMNRNDYTRIIRARLMRRRENSP